MPNANFPPNCERFPGRPRTGPPIGPREPLADVGAPGPPPLRIAVAALLRPSDGGYEVLIARRPTSAIRGGLWEFPGGKFLPGESAAEAAARELAEETGIRSGSGSAVVVGSVRHHDAHLQVEASIELWLVVFRADAAAKPQPLASTECRWERIELLHRHEWPAANEELNRMLEAHLAAG